MKNWMEKFENRQDLTYENILNEKLDKLIDLVDGATQYNTNSMLNALTSIVELYEKLKNNSYDFDEKDMIFRKKQLAELRYRKLKVEHMDAQESKSWNEFEEDEMQDER